MPSSPPALHLYSLRRRNKAFCKSACERHASFGKQPSNAVQTPENSLATPCERGANAVQTPPKGLATRCKRACCKPPYTPRRSQPPFGDCAPSRFRPLTDEGGGFSRWPVSIL